MMSKIFLAIGIAMFSGWIWLLHPTAPLENSIGAWISIVASGLMLSYFGAFILTGLIYWAKYGDDDPGWGQ